MQRACHHCQGTGFAAAPDEEQIAVIAAALRAACQASGAAISVDDRVSEATAAVLLGKATKTLRNWRFVDRPIPYVERRRRISYAVADLARYLCESSSESVE